MYKPPFPLPVLTSAAVAFLAVGWVVASGSDVEANTRAAGAPAAPLTGLIPSQAALPPAAPPASASVSPLLPSPVVPRQSARPASGAVPARRTTSRSVRTAPNPNGVLAGKIAAIDKAGTASVSVAVLDTGDARAARYAAPAGRTYDTASIAKVDILAALLLRAQDRHRSLTSSEKSYATSMIDVSDNASADALWAVIGGAPALDAANRRLGLHTTTAGSGGHWGLTRTTAGDQLVLLEAVFGDGHSALNASSRAYIRGLMGGISTDQDWGVSAAGKAAGLKNGWLPRTSTGLWDINSIGRVTADGHSYLLAVVSDGNTSMGSGITLVEKAAKAAVAALRTGT